MKYISTRGNAPELYFEDVLLTGLANDGGLYVPASWPNISLTDLKTINSCRYEDAAFKIMQPFVDKSIGDEDLFNIVKKAYAVFDPYTPAPLREIGDGLWLMELFHGPTLAFKDVAMQFLGCTFDHVLRKRKKRMTIIGATSGDTGSAAIEAIKGKDSIDIFMLHPEGRISEIQRRQMTSVLDKNVHNIAVNGTFDDCQALVKEMFNDRAFRKQHNLSAVNSINWARIMAQIVYYVTAAADLGASENRISFCIPTGNFGNVYAGYAAARMGIPIRQLLVASNRNDILTRFFNSGVMSLSKVHETLSPSMDIQVSSNFERLLFELFDRDGSRVLQNMQIFQKTGKYEVLENELQSARSLFGAACYDDQQTIDTIHRFFDKTGEQIDPHTAVALSAATEHRSNKSEPMVVLSTAHPAKFSKALEIATGVSPPLPKNIKALLDRKERCTSLPNDLSSIKNFIDDTQNRN